MTRKHTYKIARGRHGTGHYPGGQQGDDLRLVARINVPDDQFTIQRTRHQMSEEESFVSSEL